ncbi:hypothetical protein FKG96_12320 [Olivibacter sp. LS-1]|uniref:YopX family protein n=1 Tax=Olivibacter sp. LS-1 TaxID=2592345 RepID=UPI0011EB2950|nr:YopX family protein [Olivibacter sp. LS-1]QEL01557.1 hypothetical protein FKG96_12320 [Olivibacter sp. LS-1]
MNREIKFKGKTVSGKWVYGNYSHIKKDFSTVKSGHYISNSVGAPFAYLVRPETIGQSTGLKDKTGKDIYEGDKIRKPGSDNIYTVVFFDGAFYLKNGGVNHRLSWTTNDGEVVGNIHDNPEFLKGGSDE